jgi:plasmid stabilization system protein ParE
MSEKKSSTKDLATDIEKLTGGAWSPKQRAEIEDLIRQYRFVNVSAALERIRKLLRDSGHDDLSEKIFTA